MPLFDIKKSKDSKGSEDKSNVYTNIFEKKEEKKAEKDESKVISGVFAKEEEKTKPKEKILGPLPELQKKVIGAFDPTKRNLKIIR
jgi:hypothetical protein